MTGRITTHEKTPSAQEGVSFDDLEEQLGAQFARALRRDMADTAMDALCRQIEESVQSLKEQAETPEDRVIRLCRELVEVCRPQSDGPA